MKIVNCPPAGEAGKLKIAKHSGFTLIEMLVVVFVIGIGLVGALSFFNINMNSQFEAKNELIAAGLAQEGVDLVINLKDYNQLNSSSGLKWYSNICKDAGHKCQSNKCQSIDFNSLGDHICYTSGNSERFVCLDSATKKYYQCSEGNLDKTVFTRTVDISACAGPADCGKDLDAAGNYMQVEVTVEWNGRTTTAIDNLYNNNY